MDINSYIIIVIAAMFLMAIAVILFVVLYQRRVIKHQMELKILSTLRELEILKASIQGEEEERKRIADELHDDVGATLSSARLFLDTANGTINTEQIAISKSLIDDSLSKIRAVSYKLQPASLITLGLPSAVKNMVDMLNKSGQLQVSLHVPEGFPRLVSYTELHLYRILQEVITNITKHTGAKQIDLDFIFESNIQVRIIHDGEGLTNQKFKEHEFTSTGQGLRNLTNRIRILDGKIDFYKEDNLFSVLIRIPFLNDKIEQ